MGRTIDVSELLALVERIEGVLSEHRGGEADDIAKAKVLALVHAARTAKGASDLNIRGKLADIEEYAGILYSARRHQHVPGGASQARAFIVGDCMDIRTWADVLCGKTPL